MHRRKRDQRTGSKREDDQTKKKIGKKRTNCDEKLKGSREQMLSPSHHTIKIASRMNVEETVS